MSIKVIFILRLLYFGNVTLKWRNYKLCVLPHRKKLYQDVKFISCNPLSAYSYPKPDYRIAQQHNQKNGNRLHAAPDDRIQFSDIMTDVKIICEERMKNNSLHWKFKICYINFKLPFSYTQTGTVIPKYVQLN